MGKVNQQNERSGQQGTNEPWQRPGQTSQDPGLKPPSREERQRDQEDNKTA